MEDDLPSDADLAALLDEARSTAAARSRSSRRWLRQQALAEARLSGVLLSAAEQHATVTIRTTSGRTHTGPVDTVGADFCAVRTSADTVVYIRASAITLVQPDRGLSAPPAADERSAAVGTTLDEALAADAPEQPDVSFVCQGQRDAVPGRLLAVGADVASVEVDQRRSVAYVALSSVTEVSRRPSG